MNIAIMHYHLERGGVTQVIANHLRAVDRAGLSRREWRVGLLFGRHGRGFAEGFAEDLTGLDVRFVEVPELDYATAGTACPVALAERLRSALQRLDFAPQATVLHTHNHALGKNHSLPGALESLAREGYALLLQIHDFAEDFRPDAYRAECDCLAGGRPEALGPILYPQAQHIHYAVLNSRDAEILRQAGCQPARLHILPNCVVPVGQLPRRAEARRLLEDRFGVPPDRPYYLYPVRGIARKNIGEMLLLSALAGDGASFGLTLAPTNPAEGPLYRRWTRLADQLGLGCVFETGGSRGLSFRHNLAAADKILTTSLAEGFGMVFLESWLAGRLLVGRDLPEITADFRAAGIDLGALHPRIAVPIAWVGMEAFCASFQAAYTHVLGQYGRETAPPGELRDTIRSLVRDGTVDFGFLDAEQQANVIERVHGSAPARAQLADQNQHLAAALASRPVDHGALISRNAERTRAVYGAETCGQRLAELYERLLASVRDGPWEASFRGEQILQKYLQPGRFHPIRIRA